MSDRIMLGIIKLLPFKPSDQSHLLAFIEKLLSFIHLTQKEQISDPTKLRRVKLERLLRLLKNPRLTLIYGDPGFELAYTAHTLEYKRLVSQGVVDKDKIFICVSEKIFEQATERKRKNNESAFRIFASLIRRKHNHDEWLRSKREQLMQKKRPPKRQRTLPGQLSLYH